MPRKSVTRPKSTAAASVAISSGSSLATGAATSTSAAYNVESDVVDLSNGVSPLTANNILSKGGLSGLPPVNLSSGPGNLDVVDSSPTLVSAHPASASPVDPTQPSFTPQAFQEALHARNQQLDSILNPMYWRIICPGLHISPNLTHDLSESLYSSISVSSVSAPEASRCDILRSGYARSRLKLSEKNLWDLLYVGIFALKLHGWPPHFICLFDEIWILAGLIQKSIIDKAFPVSSSADKRSSSSSLLAFTMDFLALYVDPKYGNSSGFGPHRDFESAGVNLAKSFFPDGSPKYVNCWVPVIDSTTFNGCLYAIPKESDPGYVNGDVDGVNPVLRGISSNPSPSQVHSNPFPAGNYQNLQKMRALPVERHNCLLYSHRLLHWCGTVENEECSRLNPRVSISFAFADPSFKAPYIRPSSYISKGLVAPTLEQRVCLAAGQGIAYHRQLKLDRDLLTMFSHLFSTYSVSREFDVEYRDRINAEYQTAIGNSVPSSAKSSSTGEGVPAPPPSQTGFGIFKDIFKSSTAPSVKSSASNSRSVSPIMDQQKPIPAAPKAASSKSAVRPKTTPVSNKPPAKKEKPVTKRSSADLVSAVERQLRDLDFDIPMPPAPFSDVFDQQRFLDVDAESVPSLLNSTREERAKHLYSIFFNEDGTQKITGSDLKNVVPIVCPDYSAVQRMAQGFYGNAKEFDNQGKMFGSIALDLIQNVPLFTKIPGDYNVLQSSARRVGIKIKDNHLRSIGQAFNVFLREACYTYLLFFRTIIPTMVTHCSSSATHRETFDATLHSRRIQQDFSTTLCILVSLLPLGPLYTEPIVDVIDTLLDAAREMSSPILLADACHLMGISTPPRQKWTAWRNILDGLLRKLPNEGELIEHDLLKSTLLSCKQHMDEVGACNDSAVGAEWMNELNSLAMPAPWEIAFVLLGSLSDMTISNKSLHISRLPIEDVATMKKVTHSVHQRAINLKDRSECFAGFCVKLAYHFLEFPPECTKKIMKQLGTRNRSKATKRSLFSRFLLRECQTEFYRAPPTFEAPPPLNATTPDQQKARANDMAAAQAEYMDQMTQYNRRRKRNVRLLSWLIRLGMFSPALALKKILPHLLRDRKSPAPSVDIESATICLKMTGQALDKVYPRLIDDFMARLKSAATSNTIDEDVKDDVAYLIFRRSHNWRDDSEMYVTSESE